MNTYHCSLSAINGGRGKASKKGFFGALPKKINVPWKNETEMFALIGFVSGDWILSTNQEGHLQGLNIQGVKIARSGSRILFWFGGDHYMIANSSNFVGHTEDDGDDSDFGAVKKHELKPKALSSNDSRLLREYE